MLEIQELCFPMFAKAIFYLRDNQITLLNHLYLICTKRDHVVDKLRDISDNWEIGSEQSEYAKALLKHAKNDSTSITAHHLKELLINNAVPTYGVKIDKITVLDLGAYGFLDKLLSIGSNAPEDEIWKVLRRADINILDFFETEIYHGLKSEFALLENSKLFLATYSGGMPLMQRALETVLNSTLAYAEYIRIFNSENLAYQIETEPQELFLSMLRQINDYVLRLDWDNAEHVFKQLKKSIAPINVELLEKIFSDIREYQVSSDIHWVEKYTVLILNSLYCGDMNSLVLWLKCIEETAQKTLIERYAQELNYKLLKELNNQGVLRIQELEFSDGTHNRYVFIDSILKSPSIDQPKAKELFAPYIRLFLNENDFSIKADWVKIINMRNNMVHNAIPVSKEPTNEQHIMDFLGIEPQALSQVIDALHDRNLNKVIEFESEYINSDFFKAMNEIDGFSSTDNILFERKMCIEYFEALHKHESTALV